MSDLLDVTLDSVFSEKGELSRVIANYAPRDSQIKMANAIAQAIAREEQLLVEAGTGIGKTFAYLVPAILADKKIIISTGTKNLQDQLFEKDIPALKAVLPVKSSLLKGRANYLCIYRLKQSESEGQFVQKQSVEDLKQLQDWSLSTKTGDKAEVLEVAEDAAIWPMVTSTADNCLGQDCPFYQDCFLVKARRQALQAQVVVVNHHLFFADLALKDDGFGELLPKSEVLIFDEAHQIPDIASTFFSTRFSSNQVLELTRDVEAEYFQSARDLGSLTTLTARLQQALKEMRLAFGLKSTKSAWLPLLKKREMQDAATHLQETLGQLIELLAAVKARSEGLLLCYERGLGLQAILTQLLLPEESDYVYWHETFSKSFRLYMTPIHIAEPFQRLMQAQSGSWIFTSATLTVDNQFDYFQAQLHLDAVKSLQYPSPFDYQHHALMHFPRGLVLPNHPEHTKRFIQQVYPYIKTLNGRTFLLFTSYAAMKIAAEQLGQLTSLPLLVQGSAPKHALITAFKEAGNAILLGTMSFWEGVDVRGPCLSAVMIDKLPFLSPGDPIHQARIDYFNSTGQEAFLHYQLPQAVLALKQGVGRLIRDMADTGVIIIGDPRIYLRDYGKQFLTSLPEMPYTREGEKVEQFIDEFIGN